MTSSLSKDFLKRKKEIELAHTLENLVNSVHNHYERVRGPGGLQFELSTRSIFIHGNKSHVQFGFFGIPSEPVELGDLIFICSVVFKGKRHFEKLTITQLKMEGKRKGVISWGIDNEKQLFLLSRFPEFRVIKGIIPKRTYNLPNMSACLGSYGLFRRPGDFTFVSATVLEALLGHRKTVTLAGLSAHFDGLQMGSFVCNPVFCNCRFSPNAYIFAENFLRLNVGEPVFNSLGSYNQQARVFIQNLMEKLKQKMLKTHEPKLIEFIRHSSSPYADKDYVGSGEDNLENGADDGGIGIIHTTINLGE